MRSTQDPTISKRSQDLRRRHKANGDKSYLLWLSPTTQARVARLKQEGETLAQLVDWALEALEGVAKYVANKQPEDRQRLEVWVPDDLVDSLRAFLLGGVSNSVAKPVAQQRESVANSVANQCGSVAKPVAQKRERVAKLVSQAEELRGQGLSWREIARRWNAEGIPTPTGKGKWHNGNVARLVKNTARPA
jgi:Recombinase